MPKIDGASQVKIRSLEVGVCGTDREICTFVYGSPPDGFDYLVLGHESLGEVIEVGSGVSQFKPGDLVVPSVRRPCRHAHCLACREDKQDFCYTGDFTERGIKMTHGFLTEFYRSEEHTSELQSQSNLVCRLLLEKKKKEKQTSERLKCNVAIP